MKNALLGELLLQAEEYIFLVSVEYKKCAPRVDSQVDVGCYSKGARLVAACAMGNGQFLSSCPKKLTDHISFKLIEYVALCKPI